MLISDSIFHKNSIGKIIDLYKKKELIPVDLAESCINQINQFEEKYRAWVCLDQNFLLSTAHESKNLIDGGHKIRNLEGIPIGVKDIYNTSDFPTQMGSPLWKDFTPGNDARVVYYLKDQGAIVAGKTVTAEFAVHALNETMNPHDVSRTPGTSSSGSAVAVSLGMVPIGLGTQTAGSIIRPASFCGIYGFKPSFGLIPRTGMLKTTDTLDTIGFFTFYLEDLKRTLDSIRVHGSNFPFSNNALTDENRQNKPNNRPWKVAFVKTHTWSSAPLYAQNSLVNFVNDLSKTKDIEITEIALPDDMNQSHEIHEKIYNKNLSYYFKEEFKNHELISPIMNELIVAGNKISAQEYKELLSAQSNLITVMDDFFGNFDIIISLSTAGEAPLREVPENPDPSLMWTLTHLPSVNIPAFKSPNNLPFGFQVAARKYNDYLLLAFLEHLKNCKIIPEHGIIPSLT